MKGLIALILICGPAVAQSTRPAYQVGRIADPAIRESSGIVESRRFPGVFWTLNDSGNPPMIFAIDRQGKTLASYRIAAVNRDWEDIAVDDDGHLYLADTGNNALRKHDRRVYQVDEPNPDGSTPGGALRVRRTWTLRYPADAFDCESLFVFGDSGYLVSKHRDGSAAAMYRFGLDLQAGLVPQGGLAAQAGPTTLEKVADLPIRFPVTAADISRDGKRVAVLTVAGPFLFDLPAVADVASMAKSAPRWIAHADFNAEAVCFTAEGLLVASESRPILLFKWADFGPAKQ